MNQKTATAHVATYAAENVPTAGDNQSQYIEATETELLSLHEGNFVRYGVKPSEFAAWRGVWEQRS